MIRALAALAVASASFLYLASVVAADARQKDCAEISCDQPTAVKKGTKVPVWTVAYCVVGNPGSYREIDCKSPRAVHTSPLGRPAVCFIGSDGKVHWDAQREVHVGRPFINRLTGGRWQPDWQDARPY